MRFGMFFFVVAVAAIVLGSMQAAFAGEAPKPKISLVEPEGGAQAQAEAHAMVRVDETPASCCAPVYCAPFCCRPVYCVAGLLCPEKVLCPGELLPAASLVLPDPAPQVPNAGLLLGFLEGLCCCDSR